MSLRDDLEDTFLTGDVSDASTSTSIDWSALGLGVVGSVILAFVVGVAESILAAGEWVSIRLLELEYYVVSLGRLAGVIVSSAAATATESWSSFVGVLGPAAYPASVLAALALLYTVWVVVDRGG